MSAKVGGFVLTSSPHIFGKTSTPRIMMTVMVALAPAVVMSMAYFGVRVALLYALSATVAMATEAVTKMARQQDWRSIGDGSAALTGVLLVMTLPPSISPLLVALASAFSIFIGKEVFGGLGANIFNPALVGRAFLSAAYPVAMTQYSPPRSLFAFLGQSPDAVSQATPLAAARFEGITTSWMDLFFGQVGGSIGETSTAALLIGGVILLWFRVINWRLVVAYLGTVFVLVGIAHLTDPDQYPPALFHLLSGGLVLAAFFMVTDMVTSPDTDLGVVILGVGAGLIVITIRLFGGFPEGVMYSILLMNAATPIINRYTDTRPFGSIPQKGQ
ncbi:MAG: RnfABCDGE type electron transport complex subunit D [Alkalispirochaeta sp.]